MPLKTDRVLKCAADFAGGGGGDGSGGNRISRPELGAEGDACCGEARSLQYRSPVDLPHCLLHRAVTPRTKLSDQFSASQMIRGGAVGWHVGWKRRGWNSIARANSNLWDRGGWCTQLRTRMFWVAGIADGRCTDRPFGAIGRNGLPCMLHHV